MPRIQHNEDAAEIEKLSAEIERLRAALKPFAKMADEVDEWEKSNRPNFGGHFNADDLRRARAVLGNQQQMPPKCEGCGTNYADPPSKLCPGCQAYQDHQR